MSSYSKLWPAVVGGLAQVAVILAKATDAGLIPSAAVPWVQVVLAFATAAGVYAAPPNRPGAAQGGRHEAGHAWAWLLVAVMTGGLTLAAVGPAVAGPRWQPAPAKRPVPRELVVPVVTSTAHGCTSGATLVSVGFQPATGGPVLADLDGVASTRVEGWFGDAWRPVDGVPVAGGLLVHAGYGTWHVVVSSRYGEMTGPRSGVGGDQCDPTVDELVEAAA